MKHAIGSLSAIAVAIAVPAFAQETLEAQCSAWATQATGYTPDNNRGPDGSRVRGAARGAAAGAATGAVQDEQYDNAPGPSKDANREDKANSGAVAGMAVAGSHKRQERRDKRVAKDDWEDSYQTCIADSAR